MRIGFIGGSGHHYLRGALGEGDVAWVTTDGYEGGEEAARSFAGKLIPSATWVDSVEEMFAKGVDVVSVGAVYAWNAKFVCMALERGVPVVSDKPIATTWEQLEGVRTLVEKTGLPVLTEFDMRCRPEFAAARKAVQDGLIGEPVLATGQKSYRWGSRPEWYKRKEIYGGTVMWVASHAIDAIGYVTGQKLKAVGGFGGNVSHPEYAPCEDHVVTMFQVGEKARGVVHADFLRPIGAPTHGDDRLRVAGTKGVVEVREGKCVLITHEAGPVDITGSVTPPTVGRALLDAAMGEPNEYFSTGHSLEMAEVLLEAQGVTDRGI